MRSLALQSRVYRPLFSIIAVRLSVQDESEHQKLLPCIYGLFSFFSIFAPIASPILRL